MTEIERNLGTRWFEEVWNKGRRDAIAELMRADCIIHDGSHASVRPAGFYMFFDRMRATLKDIKTTVHDTSGAGPAQKPE